MLGPSRRRGRVFAGANPNRRNPLADVDWILWGVPWGRILIAGGLIASTQRQAGYADWYQHWITAAVGMGIALLLARVPVEQVCRWQWPIYGGMVASLIAVRIIGVSALGAQSWINIGGFYVQPSEFAKVAAILLLAGVLNRHPVERPVDLLRPIAMISVPWLLVFVQPDLGSSLVFGAVLLTMLFWSGMPGAWVVLLLAPLVSAIAAGTWPWALIGWIPLIGWLAWRSLPWKRAAAAMAVLPQPGGDHGEQALQGHGHGRRSPFPGKAPPGQPADQGNPADQHPGPGAGRNRARQRRQQQHHPGAGHAAPEQHCEQHSAKHQGAAQVGLDEYQQPGHRDHGDRAQQVHRPFHRVAAEHTGQQQNRRHLGEFGGLHIETADVDPALGAEGTHTDDPHRDQAGHHQSVDGPLPAQQFVHRQPRQHQGDGGAHRGRDPVLIPFGGGCLPLGAGDQAAGQQDQGPGHAPEDPVHIGQRAAPAGA